MCDYGPGGNLVSVEFMRGVGARMYCTVLYCTALYCVVVQDQLLSNIAADHHEEPGEVVALVSNPLQPDQVDTGHNTHY